MKTKKRAKIVQIQALQQVIRPLETKQIKGGLGGILIPGG